MSSSSLREVETFFSLSFVADVALGFALLFLAGADGGGAGDGVVAAVAGVETEGADRDDAVAAVCGCGSLCIGVCIPCAG